MSSCIICGVSLIKSGSIVHLTEKGLDSVKAASLIQKDGLCEKIDRLPPSKFPLAVHIMCRKRYTRKRDLDAVKVAAVAPLLVVSKSDIESNLFFIL